MLLLNQRVDNFEFSTIKKKIEVIRKLNFFYTLKNLKIYLNKTKYFRQYIAYYVQKAKLLQQKKTRFLTSVFNKKQVKKQHA